MVVENSKRINAPSDRVWSVTQDVERWPSWTPTVTKVNRLDDGPFDVGCRVMIKQPGLRACEWVVTELDAGSGFTWKTRVYGISMTATHKITAQELSTTNTLILRMQGLVARILWPLIRSSLSRALEQENTGLKEFTEDREPSHRD